jgi:hypothetical protein
MMWLGSVRPNAADSASLAAFHHQRKPAGTEIRQQR